MTDVQPFAPWLPVTVAKPRDAPDVLRNQISFHEAYALQRFANGQATENEQKLAFQCIVVAICRADDLSYRADGHGGERDSVFAEGKRYIGNQLRKLSTQKLGSSRDEERDSSDVGRTRGRRSTGSGKTST